jgi:hypothetical protein
VSRIASRVSSINAVHGRLAPIRTISRWKRGVPKRTVEIWLRRTINTTATTAAVAVSASVAVSRTERRSSCWSSLRSK